MITGCGIYGKDAHVPFDAVYEMVRLVKPGKVNILIPSLFRKKMFNEKT